MPPQAVRAPEAQRQRLEKIVTAGTKLFDRRGFARTTMDDIAQAAGITKRTLYRYVSSKPEFLLMIHEQFLDAAEARIPRDLGAPRDELEEFVRGYATVIVKHQRAVRVFFEEEYHLSAEARAEVVRRRDEFEGRLRDLLTRGQTSGDFRDFDVQVVSAGIFGALASAYRWYKPSGSLSMSQLTDLLTGLVVRGLATDALSEAAPPHAVEASPEAIASTKLPAPIVDAAVELFASRGYAETSTQDIADAAGITKSALFYHIGSKEELLFEIHRAFADRTLRDLAEWTSLADAPGAMLQSIIVNHAVVMSSYRTWVRVFTDHDRHLRDEQRREIEDLRARYVDGVAAVVTAGIERDEFRDVDARVIALTLIGMLNWMSRWFDPAGRLDAETVGREFARLVTVGVSAPQRTS